MVQPAHLGDLIGLRFDTLAQAFDFDQQHRGAIRRKAGVNKILYGAQHPAVEHLARRRGDPARGHLGHRLSGVINRVVHREQRLHRFGQASELDGDFGHNCERAFRADQQAG